MMRFSKGTFMQAARIFILILLVNGLNAQTSVKYQFDDVKIVPASPVKDQSGGTCWCFATISMLESQCLKNSKQDIDINEMFIVRNIYIEKAKNYVLRLKKAQLGEGGLGHDVIRAISLYGAMPEAAYASSKTNHEQMTASLFKYLDSVMALNPLPVNWLDGYTKIIDQYLGQAPSEFTYEGKTYTPQSFAKSVLKFNPDDYINIASFTNEPYYKPFVLQVPDNFSNGSYYNVPLETMIDVVKNAVKNGYTVMWDADVSNNGFLREQGIALNIDAKDKNASLSPETKENDWSAAERQRLYENLTTQDDHLMHIIGIRKSKDGKTFFVVKNSWGKIGPYEGYINVSEAYFAINTVSLVLPKAALPTGLLKQLKGN